MRYYRLVILVILSLSSSICFAGDLRNIGDTRTVADSSMKLIAKGDYESALDALKPHWSLPESEIKQMIYTVQSQMAQVAQRFGDPVDYEHMKSQQAGDSLTQEVYIQKFSNHAIRWVFVFYKPAGQWQVNAVYFDDQIYELFE
jgi:hypothetical protein